MTEPVVQQRIIPGAPPPASLSKTQKKRRKAKKPENPDSPAVEIPDSAAAALVEQAPQTSDIEQGSVAPELVAQSEPAVEPISLKPSPIAELINKRLKVTTKKIGRIATYASTDPSKLNEDQKATLKTLPSLEAVQKELGEVKKAVEAYEADLAAELTTQKIETVKAEKARIAEAVAAAQSLFASRTADIFLFLHLHSVLSSGEIQSTIDENEIATIASVVDILHGDDAESKQAVINGFLYQQGDFEGVPYSRLTEVTHQVLNPPREPTPVATSTEEDIQDLAASQSTLDSQTDVTIGGVPSMTPSSSFHFMQASELETPSFEDNVEWVERHDAIEPEDQSQDAEAPLNGDAVLPEEASVSAPIDWAADDEEGLPSLPSLHAKFGTSGSVTPVTPAEEEEPETAANGFDDEVSTPVEDEGFTQARRGRGRGNRGGFRSRGGNFRGGERGRGRGGEFRGRGRGEWRGGEGHRGRGRPPRGTERGGA